MKAQTTLMKLGFRPKQKSPVQRFFEAHKDRIPMKPDVDCHPEAERTPQAPHYTQMWLDHFSNIGNIHNPIGSPME